MANKTASKSEWKTICERGNMALQFHVLSSEGQRYQLLSPRCMHTRMCSDIPSRYAVEAGGSWNLESRQCSGARCVPARAPWERWGRTAGSRQKEGRWRSGDWCLGITAKWLPCWPLAGINMDGNESEAEEPGPISGELWQERMSGAIRSGDPGQMGLTWLRLHTVSVELRRGERAHGNGKKLLSRAGSEVRVEPAGATLTSQRICGFRGLPYHQDGSQQVRRGRLREKVDRTPWTTAKTEVPIQLQLEAVTASSLPAADFSPPIVLQHHIFFFFISCKNACQIHSLAVWLFLMPWEPYIFCSLIIAYLDKLVKGIREKRI